MCNIIKVGAKFREKPPCPKHKLTHLYKEGVDKLPIELVYHAESKAIIFLIIQKLIRY